MSAVPKIRTRGETYLLNLNRRSLRIEDVWVSCWVSEVVTGGILWGGENEKMRGSYPVGYSWGTESSRK